MIDSKLILLRLKKILDYRTDTELGDFLGVQQATISQWKSRNSIDLTLIVNKLPFRTDLNYLISGVDFYQTAIENEIIGYIKEKEMLQNELFECGKIREKLNKEVEMLITKIEILQDTILKITNKSN